jgi:hypothetical protein
MNGLEAAGFVHLYGLSSVLSALKAEHRDLTTSHEKSESRTDDDEAETSEESSSPPPPQSQFRPYLFVQEKTSSQRKGSKAEQEKQVLELAEKHGIPVAHVDKGVLNTLSGNRPHQVSLCKYWMFSKMYDECALIWLLFCFALMELLLIGYGLAMRKVAL